MFVSVHHLRVRSRGLCEIIPEVVEVKRRCHKVFRAVRMPAVVT